MKKAIAILLVALMALSVVACSKKSKDDKKSADPIVGTWELDIDATFAGEDQETIDMLKTMGYFITLVFNEDGTGVAKMTGEEDDAFEYTIADGKITIDGDAQPYSIDGNKLTFKIEGETMIFNKK